MLAQKIHRIPAGAWRPSHWGGEPRVVIDGVRNWRALERWTPEYLLTHAGRSTVRVRETVGAPRNMYQRLGPGGTTSFADYLDWVMSVGAQLKDVAPRNASASETIRAVASAGLDVSYYLDIELEKLSASLLDDIAIPPWYWRHPRSILFWCGILSTSSGLHCDVFPNCNVQVRGKKHFLLYAPHEYWRLYPRANLAHCYFDPNDSDMARFPRAADAVAYECTLESGDSLYIPPGWYHQVTTVSDWAINVNFFWPRPPLQALATPLLRRIVARRAAQHVKLFARNWRQSHRRQSGRSQEEAS